MVGNSENLSYIIGKSLPVRSRQKSKHHVKIMNKSPIEILNELKDKFDLNFNSWSKIDGNELHKTFVLARAIFEIGQILKEKASSKHHEKCCQICDEVFADIISATYLATCAIDKPASIILRRVLELGVASIYLWDMPHISYAWELKDHNLSFSEMITHLNSDGYKLFVSEETGKKVDGEIIDSKKLKASYGELSDIAHGKMNSFESNLPNRFTFCEKDWLNFTNKTNEILQSLVNAFLKRFNIRSDLVKKLPTLNKI